MCQASGLFRIFVERFPAVGPPTVRIRAVSAEGCGVTRARSQPVGNVIVQPVANGGPVIATLRRTE